MPSAWVRPPPTRPTERGWRTHVMCVAHGRALPNGAIAASRPSPSPSGLGYRRTRLAPPLIGSAQAKSAAWCIASFTTAAAGRRMQATTTVPSKVDAVPSAAGGGGAAKLMARQRANSMPPRAEWGRCVPPDFVDEMPVLPAGPNGAFRGNDFEFQCRQPARLAFTLTHRRGWCVLSHAAAQPWRHARARLGGAPSWQYSPTTCVRTT